MTRLKVTVHSVCNLGLIGLLSALAAPAAPAPAASAELGAAARVQCQRAIEQVYWSHTEWPRSADTPKPTLDEVMKDSVIRHKAEDGVRLSHLVQEYWGRPIGAAELQAELDRLVADTRNPEMLAELFAALGDDPDLIGECLARPIVARRTALELYADDERIHGALREHVRAQLAGLGPAGELGSLDGVYFVLEARRDDGWGARTERDGTAGEDDVAWLDPPTWAEHLERVAVATGHGKRGQIGPLTEDREKLRVVALLDRDEGYTKVASVTWHKRDFADWWREQRETWPADGIESVQGLKLAPPKSGAELLAEGWWNLPNIPGMTLSARYGHAIVWTGVMYIVWGGTEGEGVYYNGAIFNPTTNIWWPITNTGHPDARMDHTAVWTGTHMIVYGGYNGHCLGDGGRYDQANDTWHSLNTSGAPAARRFHQAVWSPNTGRMYVWGGADGSTYYGDGAYFNADLLHWGAMSTTSDPTPRARHTMTRIEWQGGDYLAVWGGSTDSSIFGNGSVYSVASNSWQPMSTSGDPSHRERHSAVFLPGPSNNLYRLAIWGGFDGSYTVTTGALYDFANNHWSPMTVSGAPSSRQGHTAVLAHYRMLVWGGYSGTSNRSSGGVYNHINNDWEPMTASTLSARRWHAAEVRYAATNSFRMMVWGGYDSDETDSGAEYRPMDDFATYCSVAEVGAVPGGTYNPPGSCYRTAFEAFDDPITLSCDGTPVTSCTFTNNPATPTYSSAISGVSVPLSAPTGTYDFWVSASGGGTTRSYPMRVKVMDYFLHCSPSPLYVRQGETAEMTCTVSSENDFNEQVEVGVTINGYLEASPAARYVTPPPNGSVQTTFTISPRAGTQPGTYPLETGAYAAQTHRLHTLNVTVNPPQSDEIFSDGFESGDLGNWD